MGRYMELSRRLRTKYLNYFVQPMKRIGIKAHYLTFLSLLAGLASVYFLFSRNYYFVAFGLVHLFLDALDGVLARETKVTKFGARFDYFTDRSIALLLLVETYAVLKDPIVIAIIVGFVLHHVIYLTSKSKAPIMYNRTLLFVFYFFGIYKLGYFGAGIVTAYGLGLQVKYASKKFK